MKALINVGNTATAKSMKQLTKSILKIIKTNAGDTVKTEALQTLKFVCPDMKGLTISHCTLSNNPGPAPSCCDCDKEDYDQD